MSRTLHLKKVHSWPVLKRKLLEIRAPSGQTKECSFLNSGSHRFFPNCLCIDQVGNILDIFVAQNLEFQGCSPQNPPLEPPSPKIFAPIRKKNIAKLWPPVQKKKNVVFPGLGIWLLHIFGVWRGTLRENFVLQHDFVDLCLWFWGAHCANLWFFKSFTQNLGSRPRLRAWKWTKITVFFKITCGATLSFHQAPT